MALQARSYLYNTCQSTETHMISLLSSAMEPCLSNLLVVRIRTVHQQAPKAGSVSLHSFRHRKSFTYANAIQVAHGQKLILQIYTDRVTVEGPLSATLSKLLPPNLDIDFTRTPFHRTEDGKEQRIIYLRPKDTVLFEDRACRIFVDFVNYEGRSVIERPSGVPTPSTADIQVESSVQHLTDVGGGAVEDQPVDDDTDDDDHDLNGPIATPVVADEITPATSRPTDGMAVKDTPSKPPGGSNNIFSTALDKRQSQHPVDGEYDDEFNTPTTRAGALQSKRVEQPSPSVDFDSQVVFGNAKKGQKTYGGTPKRSHRITPQKKILESPQKPHDDQTSKVIDDTSAEDEIAVQPRLSSDTAGLDDDTIAVPQGRKRKADEDSTTKPLSTTPPPKKPRGRQSKNTKVTEDDAEHPFSTGKLRKPGRKSLVKEKVEDSDDDDDKDNVAEVTSPSKDNIDPSNPTNSTPQSSGPLTSSTKPPTKILLSKSKFTSDPKAKSFLKAHGTTIVDAEIPGKRVNFACVVGKGVLATTAKVVRSLALGKKVVTDQWLEDSMSQNQLLDLEPYIHDDLQETSTINRSKLFTGKTLFFTSALKTSYGDDFTNIKQLATEAGATNVEHGTSKKALAMSPGSTILLGLEGDDRDAFVLSQEEGRTVYQKNLLTQSILRARLLCEGEEFAWEDRSVKGRKGRKK